MNVLKKCIRILRKDGISGVGDQMKCKSCGSMEWKKLGSLRICKKCGHTECIYFKPIHENEIKDCGNCRHYKDCFE
ncbi:hypothetical protein CLLU_14460 [Clostridium luticellarii]|uniref:Uncharacterized protein n=1 Tax=Clostridium luticellarii TaxID=1691940 RepID=A0A2T0BNS9_9CLOT|nr:hypothetical protein CLLU_14460 [Clostridium luticellarii]